MPEQQVMSKSDRMELRRIVKARYEILREQLETRAREVRQAIQEGVEQNHEKAIAEIEKESNELLKEADKLFGRIRKLHTKAKKKGLTTTSLESYQEGRIKDALLEWHPTNLNEKVNAAMARMKSEKGIAGLDLRSQELSLLESLSMDALVSDEARAFLDKIPTVDNLMPLPTGKVKATLKA